MKKKNKKKIEEFIRVDHAGERGAIKIYEGQLLALNTVFKDEKLKKTIEEMKFNEKEHLDFFEKELKKRNWIHDKEKDRKDITELFLKCKSKIIQNAIKKNQRIFAVSFRNMVGMFGYSPYEGIRLGKEIVQLVKFYGIGGVFHSDELPNYGINDEDISIVKNILKINEIN